MSQEKLEEEEREEKRQQRKHQGRQDQGGGKEGQKAPIPDELKPLMDHPNFDVALMFIRRARTMMGYLQTIDITYQQVLQRIRELNGKDGEDSVNIFRELLRQELEKEIPSLEIILARVYAEHFNREELTVLMKFFVTSVGQKLIMLTTTIAQDFAEKSIYFQQKMATVIMPRIQMEFKMKGFRM